MDIPIRSSGVFCGTLAFGRLPSLVIAKVAIYFVISKHFHTLVLSIKWLWMPQGHRTRGPYTDFCPKNRV